MPRKKQTQVCPICGKQVETEGTCDECKELYGSLTQGCGEGAEDTDEEGGQDDGISET